VLVSIILLWVFISLAQLLRPTGPWKYYEYDSTAQLFGAAVFYVLLHGMFLASILGLAFTKRVREFFGKEVESV
jgi:hypothetical protein